MALLLIDDNLQGFGLLVIGCCPGGMASNFWTLLLDGDVNLSITMTFISSIAAMGYYTLRYAIKSLENQIESKSLH